MAKTVRVKHGRMEADVDVLRAPLIKLLWEQRIPTRQCCQEFRWKMACIEFYDSRSVEAFLDLVGAVTSFDVGAE